MSQIITGTASVTNGSATVVFTGPTLSPAILLAGSFVILDGATYFLSSITNTNTIELNRPYAGATSPSVSCVFNTLTRNENSIVTLNQRTAELIADIEVLDANTQGLFFTQIATSGAVDPGPGKFSFNSSVPADRTKIYIDELDANRPNRLVAGLIRSWSIGTIIIVRSLSTTAYASYELSGNPEDVGGFFSIDINHVESDGIIGDEESVSIAWFAIGQGLDISAAGTFAQRSNYDASPVGFTYLSTNGDGTLNSPAGIYKKLSNTSGDWSALAGIQGDPGYNGWTPRFAVATDGNRRVLQLVDYFGGSGTAPTTGVGQYVAASGFVSNISAATDIRGAQGIQGTAGTNGTNGANGLTAYQVAVNNGYVGTEASWLLSLNGLDGNDPGIFFSWDTGTTDANPGSGKIRANSIAVNTVTELYVSKTNRNGDSVATFLSGLALSDSDRKGTLIVTRTGGTVQSVYDVTGVTDATGYVKVAVENGVGSLLISNNDAVSFQFAAAGDRGTNGDGAGDTIGPNVSETDEIVLFDGTSGKLLKRSNLLLTALVRTANNGSDFTDKRQTLDNLTLKGTAIASAAALNLNTATGHFVDVSGTVTTTSIALNAGAFRFVRALAAWPITGSANLVFANTTGTSYTATAGDIILFIGDSSSVVRAMVFPSGGIAANGVVTAKIANSAVTNAKLANMVTATFKGRVTGTTGAPEDMTATQATSLLNVFGADSGSGGVKGLVPATVAGDSSKFLRGDGTWAAASGLPVGAIIFSPNGTILPGFLAAEGASFNAATYPDLFTFLGSNILPDLRDRVPRGTGTNAGAPGTTQEDAMQGHKHGAAVRVDSSNGTLPSQPSIPVNLGSVSGITSTTDRDLTGVPVSDGVNGTARTASETRVKAYVGRYLIKAFDSVSNPGVIDVGALAAQLSIVETRAKPLGVIPSGRFDFWQRGSSLAAAASTRYLADRWYTTSIGTTIAPSRVEFTNGQVIVPGNPKFFHRATVATVAGASNYALLVHRIEGVNTLAGQQATLSFYAKADAPKNMSIEFSQGFGTGGSPSSSINAIGVTKIALTTAWQRYNVVVTIPSISGKILGTNYDDNLAVVFWFDAGSSFASRTDTLGQQSGTFDIASVDLFEGDVSSVAFPYSFPDPGTLLNHCQRFYERGSFSIWSGNCTTGFSYYKRIFYSTSKRVKPTVVITDNGALGFPLTPSQIGSGGTTVDGIELFRTSNSSQTSAYHYDSWTSEAEL